MSTCTPVTVLDRSQSFQVDRNTPRNGATTETLPRPINTDTAPQTLTPTQLSERWAIPVATLAGWRYRGKGPAFLRLNGAIRYRQTDVQAYEAENLAGGAA